MSDPGAKSKIREFLRQDDDAWRLLQCAAAEVLGSAFLVFLLCGGIVGSTKAGVPLHLQVILNVGLAIMLVIQTFGHISGAHVNPAITVGSVILGTKTLVQAGTYIIAQYVGSILGFGLLKLVTPANMLRYSPKAPEADFCINALSDGVSVTRGLFLEFLATMILLIVAGAFWDQRNHNNTDSVPLKFGLCVCCLAFVFGPWTSCGMNPARSFAPAVWNGVWKDQWLFWLGPYTGAIAGASLYRVVFGVKKEMTYDIPEAIALNHIDGEKSEV